MKTQCSTLSINNSQQTVTLGMRGLEQNGLRNIGLGSRGLQNKRLQTLGTRGLEQTRLRNIVYKKFKTEQIKKTQGVEVQSRIE